MKLRRLLLTCLIGAILLPARGQEQAVRLAIISKSPDADTTADLLTAEFSKSGKVQLLERAEIMRVFKEQTLAAGNGDYLKVGQVLGADGLLFLGSETVGTNHFLALDLVAVKPGVILSSQRFRWPPEHSAEWATEVEKRIAKFTPKLAVPAKDAVPISVVNLRSAIQSTESREAERQLTLLAIERLSQEPKLFVLERRRMESLAAEKELKGLDETAFWDGSYLLDGTLDNKGYSQGTITLTARLVPPKGGSPLLVEASGSRTNYSEVVNQLVDKVLASLKLARSGEPWNAAEEADQFYAEAQWALKWNLYPQARAAAESAWALGKRNSDSAGALFQAYSESVPDNVLWYNGFFGVGAQAFPDENEFPRLTRALSVLSHNPTEFFGGTNTSIPSRFLLGYDALLAAARNLENHYYAAEARVGHEEQLAELRGEMREAFKAMQSHPLSPTNPPFQLQGFKGLLEKLEWAEYGACCERPEDALPIYHELLDRGVAPQGLPRIIGWTWQDRQRAPRLIRELIKQACASKNPAVRVKGLYLAVVDDPEDGSGSLQLAQQELMSAMWENRKALFATPENASMVWSATEVLKKGLDEYSLPSPEHEPIAEFRHRLRMDYMTQSQLTNYEVFSALFPISNRSGETAAQARDLIPLVLAYQQKLPNPAVLHSLVIYLHNLAKLPDTRDAAGPSQPVEDMLNAKFLPWQLHRPGISPNRRASFDGVTLREGRIWLRVQYSATNDWSRPDDIQTTYLAVEPKSGMTEEIRFPDEFGRPGILFEVSSNALFVQDSDKIHCYKFAQKKWDTLSTPVEGSTGLVWLNDRLYISRADGLLAVQPDTASVEVLASSRRQPTVNAVDPLWQPGTLIFARADGRLGALAETGCFAFDPANGQWSLKQMPQGTNRYPDISAKFSSPAGALWLLSGPVLRHYLIGFWNDDQPYQSLISEEVPFTSPFSIDEKLLQPVRWNWPQEFSLEPSAVYAEDRKLWILCPRTVPREYGYVLKKPVQFSDSRDATIFYFESEFQDAISVPVKFEIANARMNPFVPDRVDMRTARRWMNQIGNLDFWAKTPEGLVFANPRIGGHWLIADEGIQDKIESQRQAFRKSGTQPSLRANVEKP